MRRYLFALVPVLAGVVLVLWLVERQRHVAAPPVVPAVPMAQQDLPGPPGIRVSEAVTDAPATAPTAEFLAPVVAAAPTSAVARAPLSYVDGELILKISNDMTFKEMEDALAARGISVIGRADALRLIRVKLPEGMGVPDAEKQLRDANGVADLMRNVKTELPRDVSDLPLLDSGEPLAPVGARAAALVHAADPTRSHAYGKDIVVALLDTGVDFSHPDLSGRVLPGYNFVDQNMDAHDDNGHGTACAGIVAGTRGIAPESYILPVKVMDETGHGNEFAVIEGLLYAVDRRAKVANLSIGTYGESRAMQSAIAYALGKGVAIVCAAGNDGYDHTLMPGGIEGVVCVGALDADMRRAPFSNYGSALDIMAPGVAIGTLALRAGYSQFSGTSAAAPVVAGAMAELIAENPYMTPDELRSRIIDTADNLGPAGRDDATGNGVLNLERALRTPTDRVYDAALTTLYIDPPSFKPGDRVTVHYVVQNQGTHDLLGARLTTQTGDDQREEVLDRLAPGACRDITRTWTVPTAPPKDAVLIKGIVQIDEADAEPNDNGKGLVITPELWR